jgi:hypothetical protein
MTNAAFGIGRGQGAQHANDAFNQAQQSIKDTDDGTGWDGQRRHAEAAAARP